MSGSVPRAAVAGARLARPAAALGLLAAALLAFGLRALGVEGVFLDDRVLLAVGDGQYHARLALYSFANFPDLLTFDPYINYPDGAPIPSLPLLAWLAAGLARALGTDVSGLETILAWWSPVAGTLTTIPVYLAARTLAGRGVALGAAALVASIPVLATASHVGNADHHAAQALLGAMLLWLLLQAASPRTRGVRLAAVAAALVAVRLMLLLLWSGSVLYLGLADGLLVLVGVLSGRRDLLWAEAASAGLSAALVLPVVLSLPTPPAGPYSAVALSGFHVCLLAGATGVAACAAALEQRRPGRGPWRRLAGVLFAALGLAALLLLGLPGLREGLALALHFLGMAEQSGEAIVELMPLLPVFGRPVGQPPQFYFGWLAWLVPLAPLAVLAVARDPGRRPQALVLAAWCAALGALAVWQVRYGADFAPAASVAFALAIGGLTSPLEPRMGRPARAALALAIGVALLWPPIRVIYWPGAMWTAEMLTRPPVRGELAVRSPAGSLAHFMEEVRELTPETAGFLDANATPEYGVLCPVQVGHALHYLARRASSADGFQHIVGPENFAAARRFYAVSAELGAYALARKLRAGYAISMYFPGIRPGTMESRLHVDAGLASRDGPALRHFRLVTEGPQAGSPLSDMLGLPRPDRVVPYRLFEIVKGAVLRVSAAPGTLVSASVPMATPTGRRFVYRTETQVRPDGIGRMRVPYPTDPGAPTAALGPYEVAGAGTRQPVRISEAQVRSGAVIDVAVASSSARPRVADDAPSLPATGPPPL